MTRSLLGLAALLFVMIGSAGCTEESAPESVGYVSIPLTASGAGGATYRLPPFTFLDLSGAGFFGSFQLDDEAAVKTVRVPPGDYSVNLFGPNGETTVFPLTRENVDGTFDTVPGTLDLTPTITVTENETTPLVIRFQVPIAGPITFTLGSVDVSVAIDETAAAAFDIEIAAHELTTSFVGVNDTTPAELPPRLPAVGDTGHSYVATLQTVGPWHLAGQNFICAPVTGSVHAGGNQGFADLVFEVRPSGGEQLCIQQVTPEQAFLSVFFSAAGTPETTLFDDLPADEVFASHGIISQINARLFDGTTLRLKALEGIHTTDTRVDASVGGVFNTPDGGVVFEFWESFEESGAGTITLTPR